MTPRSPYPEGWFLVARSDEVAAGQVVPLRYFGRDLVLWRSVSGTVAVFDAHCRHMGAHLGHGGCVDGEGLRCPFHQWRYTLEGTCDDIPYAAVIPRQARVRSWQVVEDGGLIYVLHAPSGGQWRHPTHAEWGSDGWVGYEEFAWDVTMHAQEVSENVPDTVHFVYIHGLPVLPEAEVEIDRDVYRQLMVGRDAGGAELFRFSQEAHGVGLIWLSSPGQPHILFLTAVTPIDERRCRLRLLFLVNEGPGTTELSPVGRQRIEAIAATTGDDIPIWENKVYVDTPLLVAEDGPIGKLRHWTRQFYPEPTDTAGALT